MRSTLTLLGFILDCYFKFILTLKGVLLKRIIFIYENLSEFLYVSGVYVRSERKRYFEFVIHSGKLRIKRLKRYFYKFLKKVNLK